MKLEDIAKLAGVSKTTASYVINGKAEQYRISKKTCDKVLKVVDEHQYIPNFAASSLRAGNSRTIGLIIPDLENSSYASLAQLLEKKARLGGFQLVISCSDDQAETEKTVVKNLISRKIDVLIVATSLVNASEYYIEIQEKGVPVIAIDRTLDDEYFSSVISEDLEGAYQLSCTLLENKINSIGLIGAFPQFTVSIEREQGFKNAIMKHAESLPISYNYAENFTLEEGKRATQLWIDENKLPDAILITSYSLFEGVLECLLAYPQQLENIKIATFGDNRLLDFLPIKVNSLSQQLNIIADKTLNLAMSAIKGKNKKELKVIPRKLIRRSSKSSI